MCVCVCVWKACDRRHENPWVHSRLKLGTGFTTIWGLSNCGQVRCRPRSVGASTDLWVHGRLRGHTTWAIHLTSFLQGRPETFWGMWFKYKENKYLYGRRHFCWEHHHCTRPNLRIPRWWQKEGVPPWNAPRKLGDFPTSNSEGWCPRYLDHNMSSVMTQQKWLRS